MRAERDQAQVKVTERLSDDRPVFSVEFFPPKDEAGEAELKFVFPDEDVRRLGPDDSDPEPSPVEVEPVERS